MRVNAYLTVTGILFGIIAIVLALRLLYDWPAVVGSWQMPTAFSCSALIVASGLCIWSVVLLRQRG